MLCAMAGAPDVAAARAMAKAMIFFMGCLQDWCPGPDSNQHGLRLGILSPLCLPVSPPGRRTVGKSWRRESESNRRPRLCRPLHDHSAIPPNMKREGAAGRTFPRRNLERETSLELATSTLA